MRRSLFFLMVLSCVACGGVPNTQATQTRTSEIVELTIAARMLPTQNAAVPPTPVQATPSPPNIATINAPSAPRIPMTAPPSIPTVDVRPLPTFQPLNTTTKPPLRLIVGSWVAYSPVIHTRFFAPPTLIEDFEFSNNHRYALVSPSNVFDFEALDIYRFTGARGGDFASTWQSEMATYQKNDNVRFLSVTNTPHFQQVAAYQGNVGQFHYSQVDNDLQVSGTMWVGQVGGDEVVIIYRCASDRDNILDGEFAQVIATIDFDARG